MTEAVAERLFYTSPELTFAATVTDIRLVSLERKPDGDVAAHGPSQLWQVALDRTAFYPESGGQPWDTGRLVATARSGATLEVAVERVEEDEAGEVWHFVRKPLVAGTEVVGHVDAARRLDHTHQHSGQHLLSAVFAERGVKTVSFHLGQESSTIDLRLPEGMERLSPETMQAVEDRVNALIAANGAVRLHTVDATEAAAMLARGELRKLPERAGPIRLVEIAGVELNACGGTHVSATGAIGCVLLRRVETVRSGVRVEFLCGARAVHAARRDFDLLASAAGLLSVGAGATPARIASLLEQGKAAAKASRALLEELARLQGERLVAGSAEGTIVSATFAGREVDFAKRVASHAAARGRDAVIGSTDGHGGSVVLARKPGSTLHAGNTLREVLQAAGARGGGSAELAQWVCRADQVDSLLLALAERVGRAEA